MKVFLALLLGYLTILILTYQTPTTQHPPKEELPYWCTYVKNCDLCWDCQDSIYWNKVISESISINSIINCRVTCDSQSQSCFYEILLKIPNHHSMECSYPGSYENEMFMEKWRDENWSIIIKHYCFYLVFSFAFAGCVAFAICKNLRLSTTMKLLMLLSILVCLSQPILNN
ncbi:p110-12L [African swine fever virus]|uniref:MGF 110-12L n=1 Tax=African swine fever virus TaxID=10497 RepID=A0A0C5BCI2_ASF|nr:MGF 110-12L [African swine fever virus]AJL34188.1 MGF 110-12L [African swine fever virus]AXB49238.1 p110-12L [African swine fever virus]AXB49412.1 p110-12L [African swine fever virus]AXB49584.1 p110-12L [African swine fever virus]AXB49757.1 p110-12L [African swine fever virus]